MSDPYVDSATGVLRNRLAITDADQLARVEAHLAFHAEIRLYAAGTTFRRYDLPALKAVHRQLFVDVYDWAGELRTVDLAKGATTFARARHLRPAAEQVFRRLARDGLLRDLDRPRFARAAGRLLADLNALHPFREGNGRAQRAFLQLLARDAGYQLRWGDVDPSENVAVSTAAMSDSDAFGPLLDADPRLGVRGAADRRAAPAERRPADRRRAVARRPHRADVVPARSRPDRDRIAAPRPRPGVDRDGPGYDRDRIRPFPGRLSRSGKASRSCSPTAHETASGRPVPAARRFTGGEPAWVCRVIGLDPGPSFGIPGTCRRDASRVSVRVVASAFGASAEAVRACET